MKKKNQKTIRFRYHRKKFHFNFGVLIFAFVLIYLAANLISFFTTKHINIYEVQMGQIAKSSYHTGLALRSEEITYSDVGGSINYYSKEGDKVGCQDLICSIDTKGSISSAIQKAGLDASTMSKEDLIEVQQLVNDYTDSHSDMQFFHAYSFKETINENVTENLYLAALQQLSDQTDSAISENTFTLKRAAVDGVLSFYTDGYENVTPDKFESSMYNPSGYTKNNLKSNSSITSGQALYKTVSSENWYLMVPITAKEAKQYTSTLESPEDSFVLRVTFRKDDSSMYAAAVVRSIGRKPYLQLKFNTAMVRYISDRYLEVELGSADPSGLKIPNSSITTKQFYVIPTDFLIKSDDGSYGVMKSETYKKKSVATFYKVNVYSQDEEKKLSIVDADENEIALGDTLLDSNSDKEYVIQDTRDLEGVYNMNKGYAVFRMIEPIVSNEEYTIVKRGTKFGLTLYDRIALDCDTVAEGEYAN